MNQADEMEMSQIGAKFELRPATLKARLEQLQQFALEPVGRLAGWREESRLWAD